MWSMRFVKENMFMKNVISQFVFVTVLLCLIAVYDASGQQGDEAAIKTDRADDAGRVE